MKKWEIIPVWGRILQGYKPFLAVEVTRECPLHCPGCYAYDENHLNNGKTLKQMPELRGDDLIAGIMALIERYNPIHLSIIGGEPQLRQREMNELLPRLNKMGLEVQFVTSAVRPIPASWAGLANLHIAVSVDGLQPEHDRRRAPATYKRILSNIAGQNIIVHCVILRPMLTRPNYLSDFASFWSDRRETRRIWFSLYTPQHGEESQERLTAQERAVAIEAIRRVSQDFPKVQAPGVVIEGYQHPPPSPGECLFAQTTTCVSPDLKTLVTPCQLGGDPMCSECGCYASAALASIGRFNFAGMLNVDNVFKLSRWIGITLHPDRRQAFPN